MQIKWTSVGNVLCLIVGYVVSSLASSFPVSQPTYSSQVAPTVQSACYWSEEEANCAGSLDEVVVSSISVSSTPSVTTTTTIVKTFRKKNPPSAVPSGSPSPAPTTPTAAPTYGARPSSTIMGTLADFYDVGFSITGDSSGFIYFSGGVVYNATLGGVRTLFDVLAYGLHTRGDDLFFTSAGYVRKRSFATGEISVILGDGNAYSYFGNGVPATAGRVMVPFGVWSDTLGNVYFGCEGDENSVVRMIDTNNIVRVVAGVEGSMYGYDGDGGPATTALLHAPRRVTGDSMGVLYISDNRNNVVRRVDTSGIISTIAGNGENPYSGEFVPATSSGLYRVDDLWVDTTSNDMYVSSNGNQRIHLIRQSTQLMQTYVGNGVKGDSGDGGPGTSASVSGPMGLYFAADFTLYFCEFDSNQIRSVKAV